MTTRADIGPGHRVLGRYEIVRHIATGGMGTVWEARDLTLDQPVALKQVGFGSLPEADAEQSRLRTLREARFAAQLRGHPRIVPIYDVQEADGEVWLVLEYVPSQSLADVTRDGETLDVGQAARIGAAVAEALAAAHQRGIIHRDIKPGNVLLSLDGDAVKLTDFGISHAVGEHPLTSVNVLSATPAYMSREVARGDDETPASDVFSLGATLYKVVEGSPPFGEGGNHRWLLQQVANGQIAPPRRAGPLTPVLLRMLDPDPAARPDASAVAQTLADVARDPDPSRERTVEFRRSGPDTRHGAPDVDAGTPPRTRRRWPWIAGAAVAAAGLVAGVLVFVNRSDPTAIPELPESVPTSLAMDGDPRTADPCALLDPVVMGRFGQPATIGPGANIGECRLSNATQAGPTVYTETHYATTRTEDVPTTAQRQDLGGIAIARLGTTTQGCTTALLLRDGTLVKVETRPRTSSEPVGNLCEINEAAVAVAVDRLAESGVVHRPGWQGPVDLATKDACRVLDDEYRQVPGLNVGQRNGNPDGAFCYVGNVRAGSPLVTVRLGLEPTGNLSGYGTQTSLGDETAYVTRGAGYYSPNPASCSVYILHKPSYDGGASGPAEYIEVTSEGTQPQETLCAQARSLAVAANRNASS